MATVVRSDTEPAARPRPTSARRSGVVRRILAAAVVLVLLLGTPLYFVDSTLATLAYCAVFALGALGLTILTGYAGQLSIAQPFFIGVGAYLSAYLGVESGWNVLALTVLVVVAGGVLGALAGLVAVRLSGIELAIVSIALIAFGDYLFNQWKSVTGGENGRSAAFSLEIGGLDLAALPGMTRSQSLFVVCWTAVLLVALVARAIRRQRAGRAMMAIREHERAAEVIGIDVRAYKIGAFALASAIGALAGLLYAALQQYITPLDFDLNTAVLFLAIVVVGGVDRPLGAVLGALLVYGAVQWVSSHVDSWPFDALLSSFQGDAGLMPIGSFLTFFTGLLLIVVLLWEPQGLVGLGARAKRRIASWDVAARLRRDHRDEETS